MQYGIVSWSGPRQLSEAEVEAIRRRVERVAPALARMEWRDDGYNPFSQVTLTARRVNLANIGREARAILRFGSVDDIDRADVERWTRAVVDVFDTTIGDVTITACRSYQIIENDCQVVTRADLSCAEAELTPSIKRESRKWCKLEGRVSAPGPAPVLPPALDEQEDRQIARLDLEQRLALDRLQAAIIDYITTYHADPHQLLMQLRGKHAIIAPGHHAELIPFGTPLANSLHILSGNPLLAEQGAIIVAGSYFHDFCTPFPLPARQSPMQQTAS